MRYRTIALYSLLAGTLLSAFFLHNEPIEIVLQVALLFGVIIFILTNAKKIIEWGSKTPLIERQSPEDTKQVLDRRDVLQFPDFCNKGELCKVTVNSSQELLLERNVPTENGFQILQARMQNFQNITESGNYRRRGNVLLKEPSYQLMEELQA